MRQEMTTESGLMARLLRRIVQILCHHETIVARRSDRMWTECIKCGYETAGWDIPAGGQREGSTGSGPEAYTPGTTQASTLTIRASVVPLLPRATE